MQDQNRKPEIRVGYFSMRNPYMKFQDDISNMNTYIRTYIHTDKPKPICPPLFQSWGHNNQIQREHMVNRVSSYFPKGGHSATQTELKNMNICKVKDHRTSDTRWSISIGIPLYLNTDEDMSLGTCVET